MSNNVIIIKFNVTGIVKVAVITGLFNWIALDWTLKASDCR